MTRTSTNALLQAAARKLAWELYSAASFCRLRSHLNVEKFERELSSAARQWKRTCANLNTLKGERNNGNARK